MNSGYEKYKLCFCVCAFARYFLLIYLNFGGMRHSIVFCFWIVLSKIILLFSMWHFLKQ